MAKKEVKKKVHKRGYSSIVKQYTRVWDDKLCKFVIKVTGEYDIAEKIQASNNVSDLALYYKQLNSGLVNPNIEIGKDTIKGSDELFPRSIHDFKKNVDKAYGSFGSLPKEIKDCFNGDSKLYMKSLVDGSYISIIKDHLDKLVKVPTDTPKGDGE